MIFFKCSKHGLVTVVKGSLPTDLQNEMRFYGREGALDYKWEGKDWGLIEAREIINPRCEVCSESVIVVSTEECPHHWVEEIDTRSMSGTCYAISYCTFCYTVRERVALNASTILSGSTNRY